MKELAEKYEIFFLKKNPRIYSDKKGEKDSQVKQIIKIKKQEIIQKKLDIKVWKLQKRIV